MSWPGLEITQSLVNLQSFIFLSSQVVWKQEETFTENLTHGTSVFPHLTTKNRL